MLDKPYCYRFCRFDRDPCEHAECEAMRNEAALEAERRRAALPSHQGAGE